MQLSFFLLVLFAVAGVNGSIGLCGESPVVTPAPNPTTPTPTTPTPTTPAPSAPSPITPSPTTGDLAGDESATWTGYFEQDGAQYPVTITLDFTSLGEITGTGIDDIGEFVISGAFDDGVPLGHFVFTKNYELESAEYVGDYDGGNGMQGTWHVGTFASGSFQLQKSSGVART